jgi:hypothetical protein
VRSVTSAREPGSEASIRCFKSSVLGIQVPSLAVATLREALGWNHPWEYDT